MACTISDVSSVAAKLVANSFLTSLSGVICVRVRVCMFLYVSVCLRTCESGESSKASHKFPRCLRSSLGI